MLWFPHNIQPQWSGNHNSIASVNIERKSISFTGRHLDTSTQPLLLIIFPSLKPKHFQIVIYWWICFLVYIANHPRSFIPWPIFCYLIDKTSPLAWGWVLRSLIRETSVLSFAYFNFFTIHMSVPHTLHRWGRIRNTIWRWNMLE